jgi:tripartite-type tricarboxylate transporter receptor subunit TctC
MMITIQRLGRSLRSFACVAAFGAALALPSAAQEGPAPGRPVTLIVGFPPGGSPDLIAREVARGLQEIWGQPVVVNNKSGGGSMLAAEAAVRSAPDGSTLLLATDSAIVVIPFLQEKVPYNSLTDLKPIAIAGNIPMMLVASPAMKVRNFTEFIATAKARPGLIDYASYGIGTAHHISMERLQIAAGIKLNHVPYGTTPPISDLIAGHVSVMWSGVSTVLPLIQAGKLLPLAVGSVERLPQLPNVPTVAELGYPGFEAGIWAGVMAPAGVSANFVKKVQGDIQRLVAMPAYRDKLIAQGNEARFLSTDDFAKRIQTEHAHNKELFGKLGINKN